MATQEQIQKLKDSWLHDPCWDIEKTEGFEEHEGELLIFRKEQQVEWEMEARERRERRTRVFGMSTGIQDVDLADCLLTFSEIEHDVAGQDNYIVDVQTVVMQSQVRATLLLAAEVKRVADLLGEKLDRDAGESNQDFMTRLYTPSK